MRYFLAGKQAVMQQRIMPAQEVQVVTHVIQPEGQANFVK